MFLTRPFFTDADYQNNFDEMGYVKIPLLKMNQISQLNSIYKKHEMEHKKIDISFVSTSHSNNADLITSVNNQILSTIGESIENTFSNCDIIFSNFLLKKDRADSITNPHQDLSFVNEDTHISASIWFPLSTINSNMGKMRFLPKSHLFGNSIRPNSSNYWLYSDLTNNIEKDLITCNVDLGEAVVFSHSTIHGSFANTSGMDRLAGVVLICPKKSELINYFLDNETSILKKYKMSKHALVNYIKGFPPEYGQEISEVKFDQKKLNLEEYKELKKKYNV
jgi:ectoine hydroxylase-related dioxygenase (phytanoyl-CoA dioxygenase family)